MQTNFSFVAVRINEDRRESLYVFTNRAEWISFKEFKVLLSNKLFSDLGVSLIYLKIQFEFYFD